MRAAPPRVLEAVVGLLMPPACREHVLGDLHERYTSAWMYVKDAVHTVPRVIVSRARRTTDPQALLMEAFALYISFLAASLRLDGTPFLYEQQGFLRLGVPAAAALVALILGDAYSTGRRSPLMPLLESALSVGTGFLSQALLLVVSRELVVPRWTMISGGGMGLLLLSALRVLFPPVAGRPQRATNGAVRRTPEETIPPPNAVVEESIRLSPKAIGVLERVVGITLLTALGACIVYAPARGSRLLVAVLIVVAVFHVVRRTG